MGLEKKVMYEVLKEIVRYQNPPPIFLQILM